MQRTRLLVLVAALLLLGACQDDPPPTLMPTAAPPDISALASGDSGLATPILLPTVTPLSTATQTSAPTPAPTPTPSHTPTLVATSAAALSPTDLLTMAQQEWEQGDYQEAVAHFQQLAAAPDATEDEQRTALLEVGEGQLLLGAFTDAEATLTEFLDRYPAAPETAAATFWLAQAQQGQMDWEGAVATFGAYLALDDTLTTYVSDMLGDCYLALGDYPAAIEAYEIALSGVVTAEKETAIRERLAQAYMSTGELDVAIAQYDAISDLTDSSYTLARMDYLAGYALIIRGRPAEGYARYLHAINYYPAAYDSYLALIELVDAGYSVDDFQRGLVGYYAGAATQAISAFSRYLESDPDHHAADAHLYIARCYAVSGNYPAAINELDLLLETYQGDPIWGDGWLEKAKIQVNMGRSKDAVQTYLAFAENYPDDTLTPIALWRAAALREKDGNRNGARQLYQRLASDYPDHQDAPEALFRAGLMALREGDDETAVQDWEDLVSEYSASDWYPPGLVWLTRTLPADAERAALYQARAAALPPDSYYAIRAADLAAGLPAFEPPASIVWPDPGAESAGQSEAEAWLREWLELDPAEEVSAPSPAITDDPRWERGRRLLEQGLDKEARGELNRLRSDYARDALASYQLALAFREMGLYRESILAAAALITLSPGDTPLNVPPFIARLSYPAYYRDLVEAAAAEHDVDPLLLLAMIRQESLFNSDARSSAAAQGLMQVIPSTGEYIAEELEWPDYRNEDLYQPYVNIPFGAFYIAEQLQTFGDPFVALAAYNAGPSNAFYWHNFAPDDPDLYLEIITIGEPRRYIQRIYTYYTYYRALYGEQ